MKIYWLLGIIMSTSFIVLAQEDITEGACLLQGMTEYGLIRRKDAIKVQNVLRHIRAEYLEVSNIRAYPTYEMRYLKAVITKELYEQGASLVEGDKLDAKTFYGLNKLFSASIDEINSSVEEDETQETVVLRLKFQENVDVITVKKEYDKLRGNQDSGIINIEFDSQTRILSDSYANNVTFSKVKKRGMSYWEFTFYNSISSAQVFHYYPKNQEIRRIDSKQLGNNAEKERLLDGEKDAYCCCGFWH